MTYTLSYKQNTDIFDGLLTSCLLAQVYKYCINAQSIIYLFSVCYTLLNT